MALVDLILNVVGLLLWLQWRAQSFDPLRYSTPATLAGTIRPASRERSAVWYYPAALLLLIAIRALIYWGIGSPTGWTARLDLGIVVLAFRSDLPQSMILFSFLSFVHALVILYFWFVVLNVLNRNNTELDNVNRSIRLHLGRVGNWPWYIQLFMPLCLAILLWGVCTPVLAYYNITSQPQSAVRLFAQGAIVALGLILSLKYLLAALLLVHLVTSYVFFGSSPVLDFVSATARNLLRPLSGLPLHIAKFDFGPVLMVGLIFLLLEWLPKFLILHAGTLKLNFWVQ